MLGFRGSFLGFTLGGIHSSILGITRVVNDKSQEELFPMIKNKKIYLPGAKETYFYNSIYDTRQFTIDFAFDKITEQQLILLKKLACTTKPLSLIFDERPYKIYTVKIQNDLSLKFIPFSNNGVRYYSGSGLITLTSLFPYAQSRYEYIEDFNANNIIEWRTQADFEKGINDILHPGSLMYETNNVEWVDSKEFASFLISDEDFDKYFNELNEGSYKNEATVLEKPGYMTLVEEFGSDPSYCNLEEWKTASRIPNKGLYEKYSLQGDKFISTLFNAGDFDTPVEFIFHFYNSLGKQIEISNGEQTISIQIPQQKGLEDEYFGINTKDFQVMGYNKDLKPTKNYYNEFLLKRGFFLLQRGTNQLSFKGEVPIKNRFKYLYF